MKKNMMMTLVTMMKMMAMKTNMMMTMKKMMPHYEALWLQSPTVNLSHDTAQVRFRRLPFLRRLPPCACGQSCGSYVPGLPLNMPPVVTNPVTFSAKSQKEKTLEPHLHSRTLTTCHDYLASVEAPTKSRKEARDTPHIRPGTLHTAGVALGGQHRRLVRVPRHQRRSTCGIIGLLGRGGGLCFREPKLRRHHSIVVKLPWGRHGQTITQHSRVAVLSLQDWDDLLWFSLFGVTLAMRARASDIFGFWYLTLPLGFAAVGSQRPVAAVVAGEK